MYGEPTVKGRKSGLNSEGKEIGTQINDLQKKEEINIQPEQNEKNKNSKNEEKLKDYFKCSNIQVRGVPEWEEGEQEIENLFEQ